MKQDALELSIHANQEIAKIYKILKKITKRLTQIKKSTLPANGQEWLIEDVITGKRDTISIGAVVGSILGILAKAQSIPQPKPQAPCECYDCMENREIKKRNWN